jgi:asparagine N-glycosylation enzyme membrane subunit Stt3
MLRKILSRNKHEGQAQHSAEPQAHQPAAGARKSFDFKAFLKKRWPLIAIILIFALSMHIRLVGYYNPDGTQRWPWLRNVDSYNFLYDIEDVVENGGIASRFDNLTLAPYGAERHGLGVGLYQYLTAYGYIAYNFFFPTPLEMFVAWFPPLIASLITIPAYFIGRILYDRKAGILTAFFMVFAPSIIARSLGGDPDSDAFVTFFPMLSIALFLLAYKYFDKEKLFASKNVMLGVVNGLILGFFALSWSGYWFVFTLYLGFLVVKLLYDIAKHIKHKENVKRQIWKDVKAPAFLVGTMLVMFWVVTVPLIGSDFALDPFLQPIGMSSLFGSGIKSESGEFPNVYVSVAELQVGGQVKDVAIRSSGVDTAASVSRLPVELLLVLSPFMMTIFALGYLGYSFYRRREHIDTLIFIGLWNIGMIYASVVAIRFAIFLAPVFAICTGIFLSKLWKIATGEDKVVGK